MWICCQKIDTVILTLVKINRIKINKKIIEIKYFFSWCSFHHHVYLLTIFSLWVMLCTVVNCGERVKWRNNWKGVQKKRNVIQGFLFLVCFFCTQQILTVQAAAQEQLFCYVSVWITLFTSEALHYNAHLGYSLAEGALLMRGLSFCNVLYRSSIELLDKCRKEIQNYLNKAQKS